MDIILQHKVILIIISVLFMIDFITGITKALYNKNFSSEKFRKTIPKLISYLAILVIAGTCEVYFQTTALINGCSVFILVTEATSILENINEFVTIPEVLSKFLESQNNKNEKD